MASSYLLVSNIPETFHSPHLRNYFDEFIEKKAFHCFHFRHRPIKNFLDNTKNLLREINPKSVTHSTTNIHDGQNSSSNSIASELQGLNLIIKSAKSMKKGQYDTEIFKEDSNSINTLCCIIQIKEEFQEDFIQCYNNKHWVDSNRDVLHSRCVIKEFEAIQSAQGQPKYKTREDERENSSKITDISKMKEFKVPTFMPQGNIGTPLDYFKEQIDACNLPPSVVQKLCLDFKRKRKAKAFGQVPFEYGTTVVIGARNNHSNVIFTQKGDLIPISYNFEDIKKKLKQKSSIKGPEIIDVMGPGEDGCDVEEWDRHESFYDDVTKQGRNKERLYEEEVELPWEKGGSGLVFYTDAQYWKEKEGDFDERTTNEWDVDMEGYYQEGAGDKDCRDSISMLRMNRLEDGSYEESAFKQNKSQPKGKIQKKETEKTFTYERKGKRRREGNIKDVNIKQGPRFLPYMQAQNTAMQKYSAADVSIHNRQPWKALTTPEITNNKWPPWKASTRHNIENEAIGEFEIHTKGIGRKLMEAQGWKEGQGLGRDNKGMAHALESVGYAPCDTRGFGYNGPKILIGADNQKEKSSKKKKKKPNENSVCIGTVFDNPKNLDPEPPLLRRYENPMAHDFFRIQFQKSTSSCDS